MRRLRPEEKRLWAKLAATVTPRPGRQTPVVDPSDTTSDTPRKPASSGAHHGGLRPPPPPSRGEGAPDLAADRRVRRGQVDLGGRLDLHGMTQVQARAALGRFIIHARERGDRCVLVITGKGGRKGRVIGDDAEGVLRRRLPDWLNEPELRPLIARYAPAHVRHGGAGAWYIFLRRRDDRGSPFP